MSRHSIAILVPSVAVLFLLSGSARANHCSARFTTDIGSLMDPPTGSVQTVSGNCSGRADCSDYFDIVLAAGDTITVGFCAPGAYASFYSFPDLSIFNGTFLRSCNTSYFCSTGPQTTFTAPFAGTFRVRIGDNFGYGGPYTLAYTAPRSSTIVGAIPVCFDIDAIDDQFAVINDGTTANFPVLNNDECDGDRPISVVTLPGDLSPDRGGVAITDGTEVRYTPASGFAGFEEFRYTARDAGLAGGDAPPAVDQDTARVVVNVLADIVPDAVDDFVTATQFSTITIPVMANDVLGNDPNAVAIVTGPRNGYATLQSDNTIRYSANYDFFGEDTFEYSLTDANGDSDTATVTVGVPFRQGRVPIDIMPNDAGNNLNLRSGPGSGFEMAILSVYPYFDAPAQIDPLSLKLGPRQANIWGSDARFRDADGDGDVDLVVKFLTDQTGIECGDTSAFLIGRTFESQSINGSDRVNTFNCPRARKRY